MSFELSKYLVGREASEIALALGEDTLVIKIRQLPWSKHNQLIASNLRWDAQGNACFDTDNYVRECLKYMIVEAPWGETNDVFLSQLGDKLGSALEGIVPRAFSTQQTGVDGSKKDLSKS